MFRDELDPLVTAVMLTGYHVSRRALAKVAIKCFQQQTYDNRELLILNHSGQPLDIDDGQIRESLVERPESLGEFRNLALDLAEGDAIISWDDDDWHGPTRIATQLQACVAPVQATVLSGYTTVDLLTGEAFYRSGKAFACGGCEETILHRRTSARYRPLEIGEDTEFAESFSRQGTLAAIENEPLMYVRTFHGHNVSGRWHIIDRARNRTRKLSHPQRKKLHSILNVYVDAGVLAQNPLALDAV